MLKYERVNFVDVGDWDNFVTETYGKPYCFQQQDGCKERGTHEFTVPLGCEPYDFEKDTIQEVVNGDEMGVSFKAWLERDPTQLLDTDNAYHREHGLEMFWHRNFYPDIEMLIDDLHKKGLLEEGKYIINIDW